MSEFVGNSKSFVEQKRHEHPLPWNNHDREHGGLGNNICDDKWTPIICCPSVEQASALVKIINKKYHVPLPQSEPMNLSEKLEEVAA